MLFSEGLCHQFFCVIKPVIVQYFICQGKERLLPGPAYKIPGLFCAPWAFGTMGIIPEVLNVGSSTLFPFLTLSSRAQGVVFVVAAEGGGQRCLQVPDVTIISLLLSWLRCQPLCVPPFSIQEEHSRLFCW